MKLDAEKTIALIEKSGRNLKQFCEDTGIKNYNLSKYLHGKNIPRKTLERIADDLGESPFELMLLQGFY